VNRTDLQNLANERIAEAKILLDAGKWSGAYYLAGYAVEFGLKACIAKLMKSEEFPDKNFSAKCWVHDIEPLVDLARLKKTARRGRGRKWEPVRQLGHGSRLEGDKPLRAENPSRSASTLRRHHTRSRRSTAMDTSSMVKNEIDDGLSLLEQLVCDGFNVTIAFWVRFQLEEDGPWFYIVSTTVDQKGLQAAYRDIHEFLHHIPAPWRPWNSPSEISKLRLIGTNDPLARGVLDVRAQYPGRNRIRGLYIGNQLVEELVIYQYNLPGILLGVMALGGAKKNVEFPYMRIKGTPWSANDQWMDALDRLRRELDLGPNPLEWPRRIGIGPESMPVKELLRQIGEVVYPLIFSPPTSDRQQDEVRAVEKLGPVAWRLNTELEKEAGKEMARGKLREIWPESEPRP